MKAGETLTSPTLNKGIRISYNRPCENQLSPSENVVVALLSQTVMENHLNVLEQFKFVFV